MSTSAQELVQTAIQSSAVFSQIVHIRSGKGVEPCWLPIIHDELQTECEGSAEHEQTVEYWGDDEDGDEWRVHVESILAAGLVLVETMPEHLKESHRVAGNWGTHPSNGSERRWVSPQEAEEIIEEDSDGYAKIVCS